MINVYVHLVFPVYILFSQRTFNPNLGGGGLRDPPIVNMYLKSIFQIIEKSQILVEAFEHNVVLFYFQ